MPKLDLFKKYKSYYTVSSEPEICEFEPASYLTVSGKGEPAGEEFTKKVEALYPLAYGVKKHCKSQGNDFGVPKLEGLWWLDGNREFSNVPRSEWNWKLLIRMPEFITPKRIEAIKPEIAKNKGPLVGGIQLEKINEGQCAQVLHTGPYATEHATIELLLKFIADRGFCVNGLHHEIYISDPRKTEPERLKTIIRYPVKILS